jgi:hypothetical protein
MKKPDPAHLKFAAELVINIVFPWLTYRLAHPYTTEFAAIAWSAAPPTAWSLIELIRHRKLDALSILVLGGIALSLAALAFGGSPRMLMVRENLFTIPIGLLFLSSLGMKKPMIYYAAHATLARSGPEQQAAFEAAWQRPQVIHTLRVISVVWGLGLVGQGLLLGPGPPSATSFSRPSSAMAFLSCLVSGPGVIAPLSAAGQPPARGDPATPSRECLLRNRAGKLIRRVERGRKKRRREIARENMRRNLAVLHHAILRRLERHIEPRP